MVRVWGHRSHKIVKNVAAYYWQYLCIYQEIPVPGILTLTDDVLEIVFIKTATSSSSRQRRF
jgi:hypothetical protein